VRRSLTGFAGNASLTGPGTRPGRYGVCGLLLWHFHACNPKPWGTIEASPARRPGLVPGPVRGAIPFGSFFVFWLLHSAAPEPVLIMEHGCRVTTSLDLYGYRAIVRRETSSIRTSPNDRRMAH
jgi:hypothetical protein